MSVDHVFAVLFQYEPVFRLVSVCSQVLPWSHSNLLACSQHFDQHRFIRNKCADDGVFTDVLEDKYDIYEILVRPIVVLQFIQCALTLP